MHVLTLVGTDYHRFDRLVTWVDEWSADHPGVDCLVQYGYSTPPLTAAGCEFLGYPQLQELLARTDVVISHGGPSTIMEARRAGRRPIVVPRLARHDEHVDDHQERFVARLAVADLVRVAAERTDFRAALDEWCADGSKAKVAPAREPHAQPAVRRFGEIVAELFDGKPRRRR